MGWGGRGARPGLGWAARAGTGAKPPTVDLQTAPLLRLAKEWWLATGQGAAQTPPSLTPKHL
eukprot:11217507-Lingulodinium_polyedra.AAC.1